LSKRTQAQNKRKTSYRIAREKEGSLNLEEEKFERKRGELILKGVELRMSVGGRPICGGEGKGFQEKAAKPENDNEYLVRGLLREKMWEE